MLKSFIHKFHGGMWRAGALLAFFSLVADLVALLRDRILASHFGASRTLDIYYSAFKIPDLVFNLLILGALSSAFIPVFLEHYRNDQARAWRIANNFLTVAYTAVFFGVVVLFLFTRPLAYLIAPGFSGQDMESLILLMRVMFLSPLLFAISTILGSILQSLERFLAYALAPVLYNAGIIVGALYIVPAVRTAGHPEVLGLGLGVVLGALLHLLIQIPAVLRTGFRFRPVFSIADEGFRKIVRLMIPRTLGLGAYSIDAAVTNAIASTLGAGIIAVFNFANNLQFVPIAVVGVSMATAIFPRLSLHASGSEYSEFRKKLSNALRGTALIVSIGALGILIFREQIIRILFQVGAFGRGSAHETATVLGIFMLGVVAQSLNPIMSRAFYALQNTRTPVLVSVAAILSNIVLGLIFTFRFHWGLSGLAVALSIAGNLQFLALYFLFRRKYF